MWSFVSVLLQLTHSVSGYNAVLKASVEANRIKPLVKQLTDLRKIALSILLALLALYIHTRRKGAAGCTVTFILLTSNISAIYDGIDNDGFLAHVEAIGPAAFTLINSLPPFIVQCLLCVEVVKTSGSTVLGLLLVVIALSPGLLQTFGNTILLYQVSYSNNDNSEGANHVGADTA